MKQHEEALARFVERCDADPEVLAVVISGSLSRGEERADSDIDLYVVVTEERWERAHAENRLMYVDYDGADYPGGYFDIKLATLDYLDEAADHGDDPVRDSFVHSRIAYSTVPDLQERIDRIRNVPDAQWEAHMASFLAQARLHGEYFLNQGIKRDDPLLTAHAAVHLATSACRALLARDHVLFAGPKYLLSTTASLSNVPDGFADAVRDLVTTPTEVAGRRVLDLLEAAHDWPLHEDNTLSLFVLDNELAWRYRTPPPEYR